MLTKRNLLIDSLILIVATPTLISAQCEIGKFLSHPESREKFLLCVSGVFFELTCPFDLYFNSAINKCDCAVNGTCINSVGIPAYEPSIRNCTTSTLTSVTERKYFRKNVYT